MTDYNFPEIDTSYWKPEDEAWMAARRDEWDSIKPRLANGMHKPVRSLKIIERYYLKGVMPDFTALSSWKNDFRHLDLLAFIWMHPSRDRQLLISLRDEYVNSPLVTESDVWIGIGGLLFGAGTTTASLDFSPHPDKKVATYMFTGENELLFDILVGDLDQPAYPENGGGDWSIEKLRGKYRGVFDMTKWLCNKTLNYINEDCLYQYDNYLEYWYLSCAQVKETDEFQISEIFRDIDLLKKGLYRIHHFDTEKEGDTCRSRFVNKMRKILDERAFLGDFKQLWEDVKANKITIENPWKR